MANRNADHRQDNRRTWPEPQTSRSDLPPIFGAPYKTNNKDEYIEKTLGAFDNIKPTVLNQNALNTLIGIPKQPQTPVPQLQHQGFFYNNLVTHRNKEVQRSNGAIATSYTSQSSTKKQGQVEKTKSRGPQASSNAKKPTPSLVSISTRTERGHKPARSFPAVEPGSHSRVKTMPVKNEAGESFTKSDMPQTIPPLSPFTKVDPTDYSGSQGRFIVDLTRKHLYPGSHMDMSDGSFQEFDSNSMKPLNLGLVKEDEVKKILEAMTEELKPPITKLHTPVIREPLESIFHISMSENNLHATLEEEEEGAEDISEKARTDEDSSKPENDLIITDDDSNNEDEQEENSPQEKGAKSSSPSSDSPDKRGEEHTMTPDPDESNESSSGSEEEGNHTTSDSEESESEDDSTSEEHEVKKDSEEQTKPSYNLKEMIQRLKKEQNPNNIPKPCVDSSQADHSKKPAVIPHVDPLRVPDIRENHDADDEDEPHHVKQEPDKKSGLPNAKDTKSTVSVGKVHYKSKQLPKELAPKVSNPPVKVSKPGRPPKPENAVKKTKLNNSKKNSNIKPSVSETIKGESTAIISSAKTNSSKGKQPKASRPSKPRKQFTSKQIINDSSDSDDDSRTSSAKKRQVTTETVSESPRGKGKVGGKRPVSRMSVGRPPKEGSKKRLKEISDLVQVTTEVERPPPLIEEQRRVPSKTMQVSQEEEPAIISPIVSPVSKEEEEEEEIQVTPRQIDSLPVQIDLSLIQRLPLPFREEKRSESLPVSSWSTKKKDSFECTEKPSAIVKPWHTDSGRKSTDSRKEKSSRESRRSRDGSSRSPRRMREVPHLVTEPPPDLEPILPSEQSRTLDRRRPTTQHEDIPSISSHDRRGDPLSDHDQPQPKRPRTDSREASRQRVEDWECSEAGHFSQDNSLGAMHPGRVWDDDSYPLLQPHNPIYRNADHRSHRLIDDRTYPNDYLLQGRELKHEADTQTDKYTKSLKYFEAALAFIMCGNKLELKCGNNFEMKSGENAIKLYSDTCQIIKHMIQIHSGQDGGSNDKKLSVLGYRCHAILYMRMYKLKLTSMQKLSRKLTEHFKSSQTQQPASSPWNAASKYTDTPSPMSPSPSPAGSVGSVGSVGSNSSDIPRPATSSKGGPGINLPGVLVPQHIYDMMSSYVTYSNYSLQSHEYWRQANMLAQENTEFFREVELEFGQLTLHSNTLDLVRYSRLGLHKLQAIL